MAQEAKKQRERRLHCHDDLRRRYSPIQPSSWRASPLTLQIVFPDSREPLVETRRDVRLQAASVVHFGPRFVEKNPTFSRFSTLLCLS